MVATSPVVAGEMMTVNSNGPVRPGEWFDKVGAAGAGTDSGAGAAATAFVASVGEAGQGSGLVFPSDVNVKVTCYYMYSYW